jgi:glycosyltransferase involved in cell wall biosynthesis
MIVKPEVSVVMSIYNGLPYMSEAIESILNQTFSEFEFIIVDDGSADGSLDVMKSYRDDRITIVQQEHKGLIPSLNNAINKARTSLICRMDADDISLPHRLQVQYRWMLENPNVAVLGTGCRCVDSHGRLTSKKSTFSSNHEQVLKNVLKARKGGSIIHPTVMMRRNSVIRAGGYHDRFPVCEDLDLWLRLSKFSKIHVIPDVLLLYRIHKGGVCFSKRETQLLSGILARVCYYLRQEGLPDPSLSTDGQWFELYNLAKEIVERRGLYEADAARTRLSYELFDSNGLKKYVVLLYRLISQPKLSVAFQSKRKWNQVLREITKIATIKARGGSL